MLVPCIPVVCILKTETPISSLSQKQMAGIGQYVVFHGLSDSPAGTSLNRHKGKILRPASPQRWIVQVLSGSKKSCKVSVLAERLWRVDDKWLSWAARGNGRGNTERMMELFDAPGPCPPPFSEMCQRNKPPSQDMMLAFWGRHVYEFCKIQLSKLKMSVRPWRSELWHFSSALDSGSVYLGMLFSDGTLGSQNSSTTANGQWWPSLIAVHDNRYSSYCQGAALALAEGNNMRPWWVNPDLVIVFSELGNDEKAAPPGAIQTPGPTIEELQECDDDHYILL